MNILYFTQYLSPLGGGGEVLFYIIAKKMSEMGHGVHVICHEFPNSMILSSGLKIHSIKPVLSDEPGSFPSFKQHLLYMMNSFRKGVQVIRKNKIDLIHANVLSPVPSAALLGRVFRIPVVITVHDVYSASLTNYWKIWSSQKNTSPLYSKIGPIYEKFILKFPVSIFHVVSGATKSDILSINSKAKVNLIYNGIELDKRYNLNSINFEEFVLFIGRLVITKNLEVVIRAFLKVVSIFPNAKLLVVGEGPMRSVWENLSRTLKLDQNIDFLGFVSEDEKLRLLAKCSALVFPSLVEGFGLVILESFAMSKPVLVPNVAPFNEVVENEVDGFLITPDDTLNWAEKIIKVLSDRRSTVEMGLRGRRKIEKRFNSISMAKEMEQLYIRLSLLGK